MIDLLLLDVFKQVLWESLGGAMNLIPVPLHIWASKQATGFNRCSKMKMFCGFWETDQCLFCRPICEIWGTYHILFFQISVM